MFCVRMILIQFCKAKNLHVIYKQNSKEGKGRRKEGEEKEKGKERRREGKEDEIMVKNFYSRVYN